MTATDSRCHSVVPLSYKFARPSSRLRIGVIGRASRIRDADSVRSPPCLHADRGRAAIEDTRQNSKWSPAALPACKSSTSATVYNSGTPFLSFLLYKASLGLTVREGAMSRSPDVRQFLDSWPYDPENYVRLERGVDGREIILVRLPMGLEEYEVDGRPDGKRVQNSESALEYQQTRLTAAKNAGSAGTTKRPVSARDTPITSSRRCAAAAR